MNVTRIFGFESVQTAASSATQLAIGHSHFASRALAVLLAVASLYPALHGAEPPAAHSADTNGDFRLSLVELTRVIELYNTRLGTVRTGCYRVLDGSEDGFCPEVLRSGTEVVTLSRYHSGDTDRNGKLSLIELTRVIELYNYRNGTVRTGDYYRRLDPPTEDGYAPGMGNWPTIQTHPDNATAAAGSSVTFSVAASGSVDGYEWRKNGVKIEGATDSTYTITSVSWSSAGAYSVLVYTEQVFVLSASAHLTVVKPTPVGEFAGQTVFDQGLLVVTSSMLNAVFRDPVTSAVLSGTVTYSAVRLNTAESFSPFVPENIGSGGLSMTAFYGPLEVTATFAEDATYNGVDVKATFWNRDTQGPGIPANLRRVLIAPNSFTVAWQPSYDASGGEPDLVTYEVRLNGGSPVQVNDGVTCSFSGVAANSSHSVEVRAKDYFGNLSDPATLTVTTPATGTDPTHEARWFDVNGDGIPDEVVGGNSSTFYYYAAQTQTTVVTQTNWTTEYWPFPVGFGDGTFGLSWWWLPVPEDEYDVYTINSVRPKFIFTNDPDYEYTICRAISATEYVRLFPPTSSLNGEWQPGGFWSEEAYNAMPFALARISKPLGSVSVGGLSTGVLGGSRGTGGVIDILLPSGGAVINVSDLANKVIKAGPQIVTEVWDAITNTPIFNGTTTLGGILNTASIGMTTIGEWHVGMRFGETAMLWFRIRAPKVEITEVKGLYTGAGAYQAGYKSGDNLGRIYSNAAYDAADSTKVTWAKNRQFVDIKVSIPGGSLPDSARIVWEVIDPDDPSNESSGMNDAAKRILDLNDYDGVDNDADGTPDNSDGNDNTGSLDGNPAWEELSTPANDYALSGNETKIKNGISGVRLNVTDHGGDNFVVRARIKVRATDTPGNGDQTGEMTVWKKINVDYAKMPTATPLPTAAIVAEFTKAFVQFDVVPRTATTDRATLGSNEDAAWPELLSFVQRAGEFSKEGPGWFFLCAARLYAPIDASGNEKIYPPSGDYGDATVDLNTVITLPTPMSAGKIPDWVTIVNPTTNQWTGFKATIASTDPQIIAVARDDYFNPTSTTPFLLAGLNDYGLSGTIPVRVTTAGGRNIAGMAPFPYHAGTTVIFTEWRTADILATSVHELAHAFFLSHKCGNWDYKSGSSEKSCVMNYEEAFILTDGPTRTPTLWTSNRVGLSFCAEHLKAIRQCRLETVPTLSW